MGCGCGGAGQPFGDGWNLIPREKWATQSPIATTPPAPQPQPGRAPADSSSSVPVWVWGLIAVLVLAHLGGGK
jgi:hypothetical protein